jgi:hypothetical protein
MMENAPRFGMWTQYTPSQADRDADLLDKFAKAALQAMAMRILTDGDDGNMRALTNEELVTNSFDIAELCMSERARRREAGK